MTTKTRLNDEDGDTPKYHNRELVLSLPVDKASKGRNGEFTATVVYIHASNDRAKGVHICAYSRRQADTPPLVLALSLEDTVLLADDLLAAVRAVCDAGPLISRDIEQRLAAITAVLKDEQGAWRELQSCADAIQEIGLILDSPLQQPAEPATGAQEDDHG